MVCSPTRHNWSFLPWAMFRGSSRAMGDPEIASATIQLTIRECDEKYAGCFRRNPVTVLSPQLEIFDTTRHYRRTSHG
jgi:hypothetical protein